MQSTSSSFEVKPCAPLAGVRILDLSNVIAGPFCTYQLALMGAQVTKVESGGGGDLARQLGSVAKLNAINMGAGFLGLASGKRCIQLNLKKPGGKQAFLRLAKTCDVVVESFRPGVMKRLGLDWDVLHQENPHLIYCAISGFGQKGPWHTKPAYDQIVQGLSGAMDATGSAQSGPFRAGYPVCDTAAGITAAFAIASALYQRKQQGQGCLIDVSMLESMIALMGWATSNTLIDGEPPVRMGNDNFTVSPSGTFNTGDGMLNIAANKDAQFNQLCKVIQRPQLLCDKRFVAREGRLVNRQALKDEIESALATRSAQEWEDLLNAASIPCGRVLNLAQILDSDHIQASNKIQPKTPRGFDQPVRVFSGGFALNGTAPTTQSQPENLGQSTQAVLQQLGFSAAEASAIQAEID